MKFTVDKDKFLEALQKVQNVVEKKNTIQILSNVLLSTSKNILSLTATDLEVGINISIDVQNSVDGKVAISGKNIVEIVKELPNKPITLAKKENNWVEIACHKSTFQIMALSADEYPALPSFEGKNYIKINNALTQEMIDKTIFSVSTDETRYHLNGVFFETIENNLLRMASTDGHRLSFIDKELILSGHDQFKKGIIIPKKGLVELRRLLDSEESDTFEIALDKGNLLINLNKTYIFIRLIEGDFPDYEQVLPKKNEKKLVVNRADFLSSLKRVSLLANEKSKSVKLSLVDNLMTISTSNPDLGEAKEELDVEYANDPVEIGFNARYIIECLSILDCEKVSFELHDRLSPGLLRVFGKNDYTYVVMPMKL